MEREQKEDKKRGLVVTCRFLFIIFVNIEQTAVGRIVLTYLDAV